MADNKEQKLFSDFTAPTRQEWLDKIQVDLKGADFQKKMVWRTNEGFSMQPFYLKEDVDKLPTVNALPGEYPYVRGNKKADNNWHVRQDIRCASAKEANEKALDILNRGIDSLGFFIPSGDVSAEYVETLLEGIYVECVELNFITCQKKSLELAKILVEYFKKKGADPQKVEGSISFDPIEKILTKGKDKSALLADAKEMVETLAEWPNFRAIAVNAYKLTNAGAYSYQDLGYALAWGNEYMAALTEAGVAAELAAQNIKFNLGINGVYFMEIAKLRAARMLWAHVVKQYTDDQESAKMHVCAYTTTFNQTVFDSYVNMLRSQTEAMSAALGGVESMVVTPFDAPYEIPTDFAERIARNHLEYYLDGRCALIYLTRDEIRQSGVDPADLEELTSLPISIEGVKVGLTLRQQPGGSYRISVRTAKGVDACAIARRLGGGGHTRAAGCELLGDLENAKNAILAEVEAELDAPQEEA